MKVSIFIFFKYVCGRKGTYVTTLISTAEFDVELPPAIDCVHMTDAGRDRHYVAYEKFEREKFDYQRRALKSSPSLRSPKCVCFGFLKHQMHESTRESKKYFNYLSGVGLTKVLAHFFCCFLRCSTSECVCMGS